MNKKLIVANWKMKPESLAEAQEILGFTNNYLESLNERKEFSFIFCPPFVFTEEVGKILKTSHLEHEASLGAQDIAIEDESALTGEVSGPMLKRLGVEYVIIGHSERRWKLGESDQLVNKKLKAALRNDLIPIVCIGEKSRDDYFEKFLKEQVSGTFEGLTTDQIERCIVAYEPVWAISTNPDARPDNPASAIESVEIIEKIFATTYNSQPTTYLYGGSVNSENVSDFLKEEKISGVLVGGASVNKKEFVKIIEMVSRI